MFRFHNVSVLVFALAMSMWAVGAQAQVRDAGSKIRGEVNSFSGRSRPSYSMRYSAPTAQRSFSYDRGAAQGTRSYSYQPQGSGACR